MNTQEFETLLDVKLEPLRKGIAGLIVTQAKIISLIEALIKAN